VGVWLFGCWVVGGGGVVGGRETGRRWGVVGGASGIEGEEREEENDGKVDRR